MRPSPPSTRRSTQRSCDPCFPNDKGVALRGQSKIWELCGEEALGECSRWYASECYSAYLAKYPSALGLLGIRNACYGSGAAHHNGKFDRPLEGTYLALLDLRQCMAAEAVRDFVLKDCRLAMDYGEQFGENFKGFIRLNLATDTALVKKAVDNILAGLEKRGV